MKKLFKVALVAILGISLAACGESKEPKSTGVNTEKVPDGEVIGGYYFNTDDDDGLNSKVIKDEDGCVFLVTEESEYNGSGRVYGLDVEFMGGCDFPSLYENK